MINNQGFYYFYFFLILSYCFVTNLVRFLKPESFTRNVMWPSTSYLIFKYCNVHTYFTNHNIKQQKHVQYLNKDNILHSLKKLVKYKENYLSDVTCVLILCEKENGRLLLWSIVEEELQRSMSRSVIWTNLDSQSHFDERYTTYRVKQSSK
jgi:hypothetical protein